MANKETKSKQKLCASLAQRKESTSCREHLISEHRGCSYHGHGTRMDSTNSLLELSVTSTLWIWINRPTVQSTRTRTSTTNPNPEKHRSRQFRAGNQGPPAAPLTLRAKIDLPASEFASPPNGHGNKNLLRHAVPTCWQQGSACVKPEAG